MTNNKPDNFSLLSNLICVTLDCTSTNLILRGSFGLITVNDQLLITVKRRNPNVQISYALKSVPVPNCPDFIHCLKSGQFRPVFGQF